MKTLSSLAKQRRKMYAAFFLCHKANIYLPRTVQVHRTSAPFVGASARVCVSTPLSVQMHSFECTFCFQFIIFRNFFHIFALLSFKVLFDGFLWTFPYILMLFTTKKPKKRHAYAI